MSFSWVLFQTDTTALMQHIRLPRPHRAERGSLLHDAFKSIHISSFSNGPKLPAFNSSPLFSPNSSKREAQTHPFQSQPSKRREESFPSGVPALPGGGGDVSLKRLKSPSSGRRTRVTAGSDSAIPSPPEDEAVMGAAAFNPEHRASRWECEEVPRRWIICFGIKLE